MVHTAERVYTRFLEIIVNKGVFAEEERAVGLPPLAEPKATRVRSRTQLDPRPPRLQRLSGKGGHVVGAAFTRRRIFRNVTLLDHLASVTRGALVLGEIDLRAYGVAESELESRLAVLAATAFLHDADKMLEKERTEDLLPGDIDTLIRRYRVDRFLATYGAHLDGAELLPRIHNAETSRFGRIIPGARMLKVEEVKDCAYVRLADRLDGLFLQTEPDPSDPDKLYGIEGVVAELNRFEDLRKPEALRKDWRAQRIVSPHTPFLLDALQGGFSAAVREMTGMPPLVEVHHDGEFLLIAPGDVMEEAFEQAAAKLRRQLSQGMRIDINPRGTRDILDGGSSVEDLLAKLRAEPALAARALFVHIDVIKEKRKVFLETFDSLGFGPNLAGVADYSGKHFPCWPRAENDGPETTEIRTLGAAIAVAMACPQPEDRVLAGRMPDSARRETELVELLERYEAPAPEWIMSLEDRNKLSRWTLLGGYAGAKAAADSKLHAQVFGAGGLMELWLSGGESDEQGSLLADGRSRAGILNKIGDPGGALAAAAKDWLLNAAGRRFIAADERLPGRCHFTALPVRADAKIDSKSGIDGLKVSAFSGREGRLEDHTRTISQTLVSAPAVAEHRLRSLLNTRGGKGEIPAYFSSPTSSGLFASLSSTAPEGILAYSLFDLTRLELKGDGRTFADVENFAARVAVGRFDGLPPRLTKTGTAPGLISIAKMTIDGARRTGRPIHVFRGLPSPTNAFVAFDFLPLEIAIAIGGNELRLEQLERASHMLRTIEQIAETDGLGLDLALAYANTRTRLAAACEGIVAIERKEATARERLAGLRMTLTTTARNEMADASPKDCAIIDFARAMARVQAAPTRDASNSELDLGMRVALEAIAGARQIGQSSRDSLVDSVAGEIENEFERSGRFAWRGKAKRCPFPRRAAAAAAAIFVDSVWSGAFGEVPPASRARRSAHAIYRVAFVKASYEKRSDPNGLDDDWETPPDETHTILEPST